MSEIYRYLGVVKLDINLIVIDFAGLPDCRICANSVDEATKVAERELREYLIAQMSKGKVPASTISAAVLHADTEIRRVQAKVEIEMDSGSVGPVEISPITDHEKSHYYDLIFKIAKPIKRLMHKQVESELTKDNAPEAEVPFQTNQDYKISLKVYKRLLLRYSILRDIERLEKRYDAYAETKMSVLPLPAEPPPRAADKEEAGPSNPDLRVYRLATTDVFVEKAIAYLEDDSEEYKVKGNRSYYTAFFFVLSGIFISTYFLFAKIPLPPSTTLEFFQQLLPKFTFYGMLVLLAVGLCRYGKAMLDQSERLREKRHALRQGRLFVHLKNGELDINELEKAFAWNAYMANAFGNMQTETKSPLGAVVGDSNALVKKLVSAIEREKGQEKGHEKDEG